MCGSEISRWGGNPHWAQVSSSPTSWQDLFIPTQTFMFPLPQPSSVCVQTASRWSIYLFYVQGAQDHASAGSQMIINSDSCGEACLPTPPYCQSECDSSVTCWISCLSCSVLNTWSLAPFCSFLKAALKAGLRVSNQYLLVSLGIPDRSDGSDQAKLIVGIVVGLILAAAIVGLIYWLYMKNSRYVRPRSLSDFLMVGFAFHPVRR